LHFDIITEVATVDQNDPWFQSSNWVLENSIDTISVFHIYCETKRLKTCLLTAVLQFDQGGLVLQKEQYANKTEKDHKVWDAGSSMYWRSNAFYIFTYLLTYRSKSRSFSSFWEDEQVENICKSPN